MGFDLESGDGFALIAVGGVPNLQELSYIAHAMIDLKNTPPLKTMQQLNMGGPYGSLSEMFQEWIKLNKASFSGRELDTWIQLLKMVKNGERKK